MMVIELQFHKGILKFHREIKILYVCFQDDYEYTARLLLAPQWPSTCNPISSAFDLVHRVRHWHTSNPEVEGPIIVVDK